MNDYIGQAPCTEESLKQKTNTPAKLLISAAVFGIFFSYLFTKQQIGLNFLLLVLILYSFALFNREKFIKKTIREEKLVWLFSIPVIFLSALVFTGSTFLNALSILVILFIVFVQYLVLSGSTHHKWYEPKFLIDLFFGAVNKFFLSLGFFTTGSVNSIFKSQSEKKKGAVLGILIGVLLLILVVPLLLMADQSLALLFSRFITNLKINNLIIYILLFFIGASAVAGPVMAAERAIPDRKIATGLSEKRPVQGVTAGVALGMISVVYVVYAVVQFTYFFLPKKTMADVLGLTSSAYAVRGFGELLFITCLNFIIIAAFLRFTEQKDGKTQKHLKVFYTLLILFNFVIMASSHMRLEYYEISFGFTVARFISHSFMILLCILNAIMLVRVFSDKLKLIKLFAIAALLYFCAVVAINPETFVARYNIERYETEKKIDLEYLFSLSGGAVSEACDFAMGYPEEYDAAAKDAAQRKYEYYKGKHELGWQSLNLADEAAYRKLGDLR